MGWVFPWGPVGASLLKYCLSKLQKSVLFWLLQTVALFPWIELRRKRSLIINNPPFFFNRIFCILYIIYLFLHCVQPGVTWSTQIIINWVALLILHSRYIGLPLISFCLLHYTQSHSHWSMCANVILLGYMRHQFRGSIRYPTWPWCVSWTKRETVAFLWNFMSFKLQGQQVCRFFWV